MPFRDVFEVFPFHRILQKGEGIFFLVKTFRLFFGFAAAVCELIEREFPVFDGDAAGEGDVVAGDKRSEFIANLFGNSGNALQPPTRKRSSPPA